MTDPTPIRNTMIDTADLKRTFKTRTGPVEAVAGVDLRVERRRDLRLPRPERRGQDHDAPDARDAPHADRRARRRSPAPTSRREPGLVRQRIGYVPQGGSTDPAETGRGELVIQGRLYGMNAADAKARAAEVLDALDLETAADRPTGTYSGGMRRRLDVGLGIVHRPQVLFLDEPTTGLDPQARARMWDEIRKLRELGTTVFLTTHYLEEADALCDRLAIIDHGRIVAEGTSDELKQQVAGDVVTIGVNGAGGVGPRRSSRRCRSSARRRTTPRTASSGSTSIAARPRSVLLLRSLDAAGFEATSISLAKPSLDDVFLRQTGRSLREEAA